MNRWNFAAGLLMALTWAIHVFAGGPEIQVPIQASELTEYLRAISAVLWHAVTVILAVFAATYFWLSRNESLALVLQMAAVQVGFAGLFLWYGLSMLGTVWMMPQWVIFLLIPLVSVAGIKSRPRKFA